MSNGNRSSFNDIDKSSTQYGSRCDVKWTNSFAQISSVLERNAREHNASIVLFTGDIKSDFGDAEDYKLIRNSRDNFVVQTFDGVDDDADGMRPREFDSTSSQWVPKDADEKKMDEITTYQGHKYEDMPSSYLVGDSITYDQLMPSVDVNVNPPLDMDSSYPQSEYYLNDTTRKWNRKLSNVMLNNQVLPVYTSMENMTKSHHDLTIDEMKGITFQIIPQFYWKYQWSFNDYMIHRVGKLNPNNSEYPMYDMLGNVWEWVRDDWLDNPTNKMNGKTNPIVGGKDGNETKKVIRGGAFDQFCRKTISSSREGLDKGECKSKYGT